MADLRRWGPAVVPVLFVGYLFLYPLGRILWVGLAPDGRFDPAALGTVLTGRRYLGVAWFTLWQAAVSTVLTLVVALPAAYVTARYTFPGRRLFRAAVTVPFVLPTVVVGSAFLALAGPDGMLGIDAAGTIWIILAAHVFYNVAVVIRTVGGQWEHLDPRLEEAARMLGAGRWRAFREVTLPLLRPSLAAAASIVFLFTFTSFGVILILGGLRYSTLEVEIYRQTVALFDLPVAAALALIQLIGVTAILLGYSRYQERRAVPQRLRPSVETARRPATRGERTLVGTTLAVTGLFLAGPLVVLVAASLRPPGGFGLGFYRALSGADGALPVSPLEAIGNSLGFALAATVVALVVGLSAAAVIAYRGGSVSRWFDSLLMLPLGTSAVTIGFGFLVALDWPVDLRTSRVLIPLAHALVAVPFVVRTAVPAMRSIQPRLREAAAVLGAPPGRVWREVDLPIVGRAALVGAGFAFAVSLGEFGATAFIARPNTPTIPIAIFRFLGLPGQVNFGRAMAMSVVLMAVTAAAVLAVDRFRAGGIGEF